MAEFDSGGFESAIRNLRDYGTTARGDVETTFNKALEDIVASNREALSVIQELEGGDSTNAAKMVSLVRSPIDAALADVVRSMTDARQRGGYSGSPRVRSMIESTVRSLTPLAGEKVAEALATKERLGLKRAGIFETEGQQKAGINTKKGELFADIGGNVASQIASIEKQREQAKLDEARRMDDLRLGLLQASKPDSVTEFFSKLGMEPLLKNVYSGTPKGSEMAGTSTGVSAGVPGKTEEVNYDALNKKMNSLLASETPSTRLSGPALVANPEAMSLYSQIYPGGRAKWSLNRR